MTNTHHHPVLIIGSGPAGYTAAVYAARAMLKPAIVAGLQPGGQLTITTDVENYPGFPAVMGPDLMEKFKEHALKFGTELYEDVITDVDFTARPFKAVGDSGTVYTADAIVIATGAQAKWLGLPSEQKFSGYGVSACATCDGFFYRGKDVIVVGGGNTAVEEALYLSHLAKSVTLIHRRDSLRAEKILQNRLFNSSNVNILWNHTLEEVVGDEKPMLNVTGARVRNTETDEVRDIAAHGVFIAIGHKPATEVFKGHVEMNPGGYIISAPDSTQTNIPGVFAAGDVSDEVYRQAVTAAGLGCMAALEAERYIAAKDTLGETDGEASIQAETDGRLNKAKSDIETISNRVDAGA